MPAVETDAALGITRVGGAGTHHVAVGQAHETDTATRGMGEGGFDEGTMLGAFAAIKRVRMALPLEVDFAQPLSSSALSSIKAHEVDTALGITRGPKTVEHDFALSITPHLGHVGGPQVVVLGQPTSVSLAQPVKARKIVKLPVTTNEVDVALPHKHRKIVHMGQPIELDSILPILRGRGIAVGMASEADSARAHGTKKVGHLHMALEGDFALGTGLIKFESVGQPAESDQAQPTSRKKLRGLGQATSTATAQAIIARRIYKLPGPQQEVDFALQIRPQRHIPVGQASELDVTHGHIKRKIKHLPQTLEQDTARPAVASNAPRTLRVLTTRSGEGQNPRVRGN